MTINYYRSCEVPILSVATGKIVFVLQFYGLRVEDLTWVAFGDKKLLDDEPRSGAWFIHEALRRRGLDPHDFTTSPLFIRRA